MSVSIYYLLWIIYLNSREFKSTHDFLELVNISATVILFFLSSQSRTVIIYLRRVELGPARKDTTPDFEAAQYNLR